MSLVPLAAAAQDDPYLWLEDVTGDKAVAWVKEQNKSSQGELEARPEFKAIHERLLAIYNSRERIPFAAKRGGWLYNFWQDADNPRGIWRRTTMDEYRKPEPKWETVIDYDALGKEDKQSWVGKGLTCFEPEEEHCMVALSVGGEDAITLREFDLKSAKFIEGGFVMPRGKQRMDWLDKDTLLIGRDWGPGTMSEAGYPITVRKWKRGTPLESAVEVYRGSTKDNGYGDDGEVLVDGQGHRVPTIERSVTTFETEHYLLLPSGPKKLGLPMKSRIEGLYDNQLLVSLDEDW